MSHFGRRGREGVKFEGLTPTSSHWGGREREWSWEVLFIRQAAGKFVYLGAGSLLRSAVRRSRGEGREEVSEKERKEADSKSNFIPSPLVFFTLSPHRDVT